MNIKSGINLSFPTFYPFLNPIIIPGTNPNVAAIGSPDAVRVDGCAANCVAVLLSAWITCPDTFVSVLFE